MQTDDHESASSASRSTGDEPTTMVSADPTPRVSGRIGRFRLRRVIASGGMGVIYEAIQDHPKRTVALKVLKPGVTSRSAMKRFEHEAEILGRLLHPNIAQVFDAGKHDDGSGEAPYFAMEYVPNARTITEYARKQSLTTAQRLELFCQACAAASHGHSKGVLHRDLKPANILVDSGGQVKVIDFGVARTTDVDLHISTLKTDVGQLIGTIQYMSPEQAQADPHDLDMRSDVYSLGVVLYELLCERLPYDVSGVPVHEAARIVREEPPTKPSTINRRLGGDLETIVTTAMHRDRRMRYQSADELRKDIERYLGGEPIVARRPTISYLLRAGALRAAYRHPVTAFLLIAAVVAVALGLLAAPMVDRALLLSPRYGSLLSTWMPGPEPAPPEGLEDVVVVKMTEETFVWAGDYAKEHGLGKISMESRSSFRPVHGAFMKRLAECDAGAVVWDIAFIGETEQDEKFVDGIRTFSQTSGTDIVVAVPGARPSEEFPELISPSIRDHVRTGNSISGFTDQFDEWYLELLVRMPQGARTRDSYSLALEAVNAFRHSVPGEGAQLQAEPASWPELKSRAASPGPETLAGSPADWADLKSRAAASGGEKDEVWLGLRYRGSTRGIKLAETESFESVHIYAHGRYSDEPQGGLEPGDELFQYIVHVPSDRALNDATVAYEWIMEEPIETVRVRLRGKVVVVADHTGRDWFPHPDGRTIHGAYGHAAAIQQLLLGIEHTVWMTGPFVLIPVTIAGVLIGLALARRNSTRVPVIILAAVALVIISILLFRIDRQAVLPVLPILALVISCELAAYLQRVRVEQA